MGNGPTEYRAADHQCFKDVLVVRGKEKPANQFDLLDIVKVVPRAQVEYCPTIRPSTRTARPNSGRTCRRRIA